MTISVKLFSFFAFFFCFVEARGQLLDSLEREWAEITDDSIHYALRTAAVWDMYEWGRFEEARQLAAVNLNIISPDLYPDFSDLTRLQLVYLYEILGESRKFRSYWPEVYQRYLAKRDTSRLVDLLNIRAYDYTQALRYDSAYVLYDQALAWAEAQGDPLSITTTNNNLAIIFGEQGLLDKARERFQAAARVGVTTRDSQIVFLAFNNIARCFIEETRLDSARYYLNAALAWRSNALYQPEFGQHYEIKARIAAAEENYPEALRQYHRAAAIQATDFGVLTGNYAEIGKMHYRLNQFDSSLYYLGLAVERAQAGGRNEILRDALPLRARAYAASGDWENAYRQAELGMTLRDEYLKEEVQRQVAEMEAKYQVDRLRLETAAQEEKVKRRTFMALLVFLALIVISALSLVVLKKNREILKVNQGLEDQVTQRTRELADANAQLNEYLEDLRMFTHVTSHDLKEPLRNISGFSSLLERHLRNDLSEDTQTFLAMIRNNAVQMHRLIEGIQAYAALDPQRKGTVPLEMVALPDIMRRVEQTLAGAIAESGAEVTWRPDLPTLQGVSYVLFVVLKNLVDNAIKYNNASPPRVEIRYERQPDEHFIIVQDNGIGIAPRYRERVFEMFQRLHNRRDYSGTGMGLGISRKLMRRFDGDITLISEEGKGSTFVVMLPASTPPAVNK